VNVASITPIVRITFGDGTQQGLALAQLLKALNLYQISLRMGSFYKGKMALSENLTDMRF